MSQKFEQVKVALDENLQEKLELLSPNFTSYRVLRQSVDARKIPHWVYSVEIFNQDEKPEPNFKMSNYAHEVKSHIKDKPIIIGSGPAGLFAALRFVERGIACILLERGSIAEKRIQHINRFWRYGELNPHNNVCFGEGGAGLYSDGKLITRIKSPEIPYVMHKLVEFGAPEEIKYLANPHVGSDRIRRVIPKIRQYLLENGCDIHYDTPVTDFTFNAENQIDSVICENNKVFKSPFVILATGHSAQDIFKVLKKHQVYTEAKSFAMGLRIEHPQSHINKIQYKNFFDRKELGSANYKIAHHDHKTGIGVYSFCMCPGGYVLSSGTESNSLVCNGMSNYNRNSGFANSAIVVSVDHKKLGPEIEAGLNLRTQIEEEAFKSVQKAGGSKELPAQKLIDFLSSKNTGVLKSSSPSGVVGVALHKVLPQWTTQKLQEAFEVFNTQMKSFIHDQALLHGVETRTSCPIRITRDDQSLESLSHKGLYPCGEGAGYAGGITSAAVDGINCANKIIEKILSREQIARFQELNS